MKKYIPITFLRDTNAVSKLVKDTQEPIGVTKNGHDEFTIVPNTFDVKNSDEFDYKNQSSFLRLCVANIDLKIGDVNWNLNEHLKKLEIAVKKGVEVLVFQRDSLIGATAKQFSNNSKLNNSVDIVINRG